MNNDDRYERGLSRLAEIDGEVGQRIIDSLEDIAPDLGRYIVEFAFGDLYSRPGLDLRAREIATVAALTAMGTARPQLEVHLGAALNVGCTRQELVEVIMQISAYAGFPAALNGIAALRSVLAERATHLTAEPTQKCELVPPPQDPGAPARIASDNFRRHNVSTAQKFFDLLHRKDINAWSALWHPEGRISVLYPAEGFPDEIGPKTNIVQGFQTLFANFETFDPQISAVYPAADSEAVVIEYRPRATLRDGTVYTNANIAVMLFDDGLIREYHDYFDPRRFQLVVDALPRG